MDTSDRKTKKNRSKVWKLVPNLVPLSPNTKRLYISTRRSMDTLINWRYGFFGVQRL